MKTAEVSSSARVALAVQDAVLVVALVMVIATGARTAFAIALAVGVLVVLAWGFATLHFPRKVEWDDETITFSALGRSHTFVWKDVRVRVRRFLVRDRIFVRLAPAPPWRGRYWLLAKMEGYDALVAELERRT